jgi:hypothetical protein
VTTEAEDRLDEQPEQTELAEQPFDVVADDDVTGIPTEEKEPEEEEPEPAPTLPEATAGGAPAWVKIPPDFKFPRGRQVVFLKFRSEWTDSPWIGEELPGLKGKWRQCICWTISVGDKKLAIGRAQGDANRVADELSKQMIRAVDGKEIKWDGLPETSVEEWWGQVGERVRSLVQKVFLQLHVLDREETKDFFENCIAVRSTG